MDDKRPARVGGGRNERWDERRAWTAGLLAEARAGRTEALAELVPELSPMLWQVARSAGLPAADAEDVVQQAWLRLVSHLDQLSQPGSVASWLVTTTRREAWRRRSAGRRQFPAEQDWLADQPDQGPDAAEQAVMDEERRELWAALAQLSPRCQQLLRIVAFVPRPDYDAVAAGLGIPRGSVGPTRGRCLAKLRALLIDSKEGPGDEQPGG
ncbi:MAG TPA: sigma-70 family RNA polymerase sigma factor [Streptosporangiaceae bacterium]